MRLICAALIMLMRLTQYQTIFAFSIMLRILASWLNLLFIQLTMVFLPEQAPHGTAETRPNHTQAPGKPVLQNRYTIIKLSTLVPRTTDPSPEAEI